MDFRAEPSADGYGEPSEIPGYDHPYVVQEAEQS